jgi:hypothetical protein
MALAPDIRRLANWKLLELSSFIWLGAFLAQGDAERDRRSAQCGHRPDPAARSRFANLAAEIFPSDRQTPEGLGALRKADIAKWWPLIKKLGIKAEWVARSDSHPNRSRGSCWIS